MYMITDNWEIGNLLGNVNSKNTQNVFGEKEIEELKTLYSNTHFIALLIIMICLATKL